MPALVDRLSRASYFAQFAGKARMAQANTSPAMTLAKSA
jgi:hypothetical protein